jgi:hypothetical protein
MKKPQLFTAAQPTLDLSRTVQYKYSPTGRAFAKCNKRMRAIMGPVGSGKSSVCCAEIVRRGLAQKPSPKDGIRRTRWLVLRNTYTQLRDTTIKTFLHWWPAPMFGHWKEAETTYYMKIGDAEIEVLFRALDRPDQIGNLLSLELTGGWINEAREVAWQIVEAVDMRLGRYPDKAMHGGASWIGLMLDTNPPDQDSEFYKYFEVLAQEDPQVQARAEIFKQPAGATYEVNADGAFVITGTNPAAENIENLTDPNYYTEMAVGKGQAFIKVFILNMYANAVDGRPVFPEYNDAVHFAPKLTGPIPGLPILRCWDFGNTPTFVLMQRSPKGQALIFDEMTSENTGIDIFADDAISYCNATYPGFRFDEIGDPAGASMSPTDSKSCFDILRAKNINIRGGIQSPRIRQESVRKPLLRGGGTEPGLLVGPKAKLVRAGFAGKYHFQRVRSTFDRYKDEPYKDKYSHPMDCVQYGCAEYFGLGLKGAGSGGTQTIAKPATRDGFYF